MDHSSLGYHEMIRVPNILVCGLDCPHNRGLRHPPYLSTQLLVPILYFFYPHYWSVITLNCTYTLIFIEKWSFPTHASLSSLRNDHVLQTRLTRLTQPFYFYIGLPRIYAVNYNANTNRPWVCMACNPSLFDINRSHQLLPCRGNGVDFSPIMIIYTLGYHMKKRTTHMYIFHKVLNRLD